MTLPHRLLLLLAWSIITTELFMGIHFRVEIYEWLSHNLWVVIIPFLKVIIKRLFALNLVVFFKALFILVWNLFKLLLLKMFKTLTVRYGIFFSQNRWYWIRRSKVMFLRRGKQFFRSARRFWQGYGLLAKWSIVIAFFPVVLLIFLLGLSFNITRKTMVQKAQESAVFGVATTASNTSRGIRAWIARLDRSTLDKIKEMTPKGRT